MDLTYVPPVIQEGEVVVQILEEDIAEEKQKWNRALIMYVVGNTPTIGAVERFVAAQWGKVRKPKVLYHSDRYFTILLNSVKERDEVLMNGPYTMNSRPVILKAWAEGFDFNEEVLKTILLWVKFPKLPLNYWSNKALSKIGSGLGKPLYADTCTTVADRISYARVLIEMDITRTLPGTIKLIDPNGKVIEQMVQYDWKPQYCQTCCQTGHSCHNMKVQKQEVGQQTYGMQSQGKIWKVVRILDPKTDKIDTRGRFLEQLEEDSDGIQSNNSKYEQWQLAKGKSATKKNGDGRDEMEVNTGNAFTALVDTAQRLVQMTREQDKEREQPRDRGRRGNTNQKAIMMNIIVWNVRGMNKVYKQKELKTFIRENKVVLIAVLENRVKETKAESIIKKIFNNWRWIANYSQAPRGRIWIAWDQKKVDFEGYKMHQQYIIGEVTERQNGNKFRFGAVYGMHTIQDRKRLWEDMEKAIVGATDPCVLMGDYNTILTSEDRAQGTQVQEFEVKDFKVFIWRNGLTELKRVGRKYTWTNNHVHSKIDRILVNAARIQKWPVMEGRALQPGFSDHCPLSLPMDYE
ncbi:PREDICTED: uncharacterized protein LOC109233643 [Nicotiana attenuata]|uniref:uncharacterized protein LOC109233643 n=1 Tax=Nicotiana attenuata TaxID=49451 RepID=UPI000905662A|nr:PREDICTED: uncharacterized protein LOC109233643 [Nicotiana attenuata]